MEIAWWRERWRLHGGVNAALVKPLHPLARAAHQRHMFSENTRFENPVYHTVGQEASPGDTGPGELHRRQLIPLADFSTGPELSCLWRLPCRPRRHPGDGGDQAGAAPVHQHRLSRGQAGAGGSQEGGRCIADPDQHACMLRKPACLSIPCRRRWLGGARAGAPRRVVVSTAPRGAGPSEMSIRRRR